MLMLASAGFIKKRKVIPPGMENKRMLAIINAELIMPDHRVPNGFVIIEDGLIKDYGTMDRHN